MGYATRGKRLYTCEECGKGSFFSWKEENRAARLRCTACGSARLAVSGMGGARLVKGMDARKMAGDAAEQSGRGSVVPGRN